VLHAAPDEKHIAAVSLILGFPFDVQRDGVLSWSEMTT
jgi:hypothetical protein